MARRNDGSAEDRRAKRQRAQHWGRSSEYLAALYLLLKGYRILSVRYRTKVGEIDLIARKGNLVAFVEVKARVDQQQAIDAVGFDTQRRIRAASERWLAKRRDFAQLSQRYDVVAVLPWRMPKHFPDAF